MFDPGELLSASHMDSYTNKFTEAGIPMSGLCFNNRFAWSLGKFYYYKVIEGKACLYTKGEKGLAPRHIIFPLGAPDAGALKKIADHYYPEFRKNGEPLRMMYVPEDRIAILRDLEGYEVQVVHKTDYDEYVYDASDLVELSGKALRAKKNQLNKFHRDCSSCSYHTLTAEDMDECLKLTEEWCEAKGVDKFDVLNSDYIPIKIIFENFSSLRIRGGLIRLFNKVIAFSVGSEPLDDTAFIHFEKADQTISGTNVAIVSETIRNEYPEVKFVNREEDMGIEGLRIAKQSFGPVSMMVKNDVFLRKKGS